MANTSCDGARVDCKWTPLREGEMSPFKMLVALFIREVYAGVPIIDKDNNKNKDENNSSGSGSTRHVAPKTLFLIYNLISVSK